jgi:hypothetical protein
LEQSRIDDLNTENPCVGGSIPPLPPKIVLPRPKKSTKGHAVALTPRVARAVLHSDIIVAGSANGALHILQLAVPAGVPF